MNQRRAVLHCNAGGEYGMGHLMRTLALGGAAQRRGWSVSVIGDIDEVGMSIARRMEPDLALDSTQGAALLDSLADAARDADVVHLDSYLDAPDLSSSRALVSNMQDGPYGARAADLSIDANLGAERTFERVELSRNALVGLDVAVVRDQVLRRRDASLRTRSSPRVLVVMGGSDPQGLTARVTRALDGFRHPLRVTVVDPRDRDEVRVAAADSSHDIRVIGFTDDLPAIAREHDLVVTAAGTSVWDFACMGLPMGLLCAVDNQRLGYEQVVSQRLATALGEPPHADLEARVVALESVLLDGAELTAQATALRNAVDGLGTWRIVASWEQLVDTRQDAPRASRPMAVRSATADDAPMLFDWRNDESTRANSRSTGPLEWTSHVAWLGGALLDPDRRLLIVESDGDPVATARWDRRSETDWEVSITMAPSHRGQGLASAVLAASEGALILDAPSRLIASVHTENTASLRLFQRAGYLPHLPVDSGGFATFARWRLAPVP